MRMSKEKLRKIILEELGAQNEAAGDEFPTVEISAEEVLQARVRATDDQLKTLQDRVAAVERKIEDMGMGEPGTPFQESKRKSK